MMSFLLLLFAVGIFSAGADPCIIPEGAQNVALTGVATQSSVYYSAIANRAIDGNTDSDGKKGSCSHTGYEHRPWWKLDLGNSKSIGIVKIFNRQDCCSERLSGAIITLGDSVYHTKNPVCGTIKHVFESKLTICCNGKSGRYLAIYLPRSDYLTLCEVQAFLNPCAFEGALNVAVTGKATQSSVFESLGVANHAIDGNTNTDYYEGSCTHTNNEPRPWWKVDLGNSKSISVVNIWNRQDGYQERISGAIITLGDSLDHTQNYVCGTINDVSESKLTIYCYGKSGRYLTIYLPHTGYLTLCEVQAFLNPCFIPDGSLNVALTGKASQSSVRYSAVANLAIDGNTDTDYSKGSCTHTHYDPNPWWKVDLGKSKSIGIVKIFNRWDCCPERLSGAIITLGNSLDHTENAVCGTIDDISKSKLTIYCNRKSGRYLAIYLPHSGYVTVCEVQAFLNPCFIPDGAQNVAMTGKATQSSVYHSAVANRAIDGNTDGDHNKGSCSHTNYESNPWWKVDLGNSKSIGVVNIWNRKDCCPERLSGAIITLGDSLDHTKNYVCGTINIISVSKLTICCYGKTGRYLAIYLPRAGYVTLCEVQVFTV